MGSVVFVIYRNRCDWVYVWVIENVERLMIINKRNIKNKDNYLVVDSGGGGKDFIWVLDFDIIFIVWYVL